MQHEDHVVLGELAYRVYAEAVGGRDVRGQLLPAWEDLGDVVQAGWMRAAGGVAVAVLEAAAEHIDKGPTFPLPPSVVSELVRERAADHVCRRIAWSGGTGGR